jgi:hypothetical protein
MACAATAMLVLAATPPQAMAGPGQGPKEASIIAASNEVPSLIAARHYRHYRNGGDAAGLAAMGLAIGAIGSIAAQQQHSDYYNNGYYNNGYGYQPAPRYYGGPSYGGGYYRR